jgi:hypothetical protein
MSAFDDGSIVEIECEPDDPPRSGEWVDSHDALENPTNDELHEGEHHGREIDIDDDEDNGL